MSQPEKQEEQPFSRVVHATSYYRNLITSNFILPSYVEKNPQILHLVRGIFSHMHKTPFDRFSSELNKVRFGLPPAQEYALKNMLLAYGQYGDTPVFHTIPPDVALDLKHQDDAILWAVSSDKLSGIKYNAYKDTLKEIYNL